MGHSDSDKAHRQLLRTGCTGLVNVLISWGRVALCYCVRVRRTESVMFMGRRKLNFRV